MKLLVDVALRILTILGYNPQLLAQDQGIDMNDTFDSISDRSKIFSEQSAILPNVNIEEFQNNIANSIIKVMLIPIVVPFRVCKYFFIMPFKFIGQMADKFVMTGLKKLNVSKYDAKTYATQLAKKQVINIKYFVVLLILLGLVFSFALSVSTSIYTFVYLYLIPNQS